MLEAWSWRRFRPYYGRPHLGSLSGLFPLWLQLNAYMNYGFSVKCATCSASLITVISYEQLTVPQPPLLHPDVLRQIYLVCSKRRFNKKFVFAAL